MVIMIQYPYLFLFFHAVHERKAESPSGEATLSGGGVCGSIHRRNEGNVPSSEISETIGVSGCYRFRRLDRGVCHSPFRTPPSVGKRKSVIAVAVHYM